MATVGKVLSREQLLAFRAAARAEGRAVVQCHGCFDIVHPGHIRHLRQAKSYGEILLVTITGDAAFSKRGGTPLIPEELRAENLAELDCVDWVYVDPRPTAADLLEDIRPDVYVKGREYQTNGDPRFQAERNTVERHGGRVVFSSGDVVFSSTALIAALERAVDPYHARLRQLLDHDMLDGARLSTLISAFRGQHVLVVGETIIDQYVLCDQPEVAAESPVMTLRPLERRSFDGGAAIIARHLAALGARPTLLTGLPDSPASQALRQRLAQQGVETLAATIDVPIPEKQRFLVGTQKVMKLNLVEPLVLDAQRQDELVATASEAAEGFDAAIVADFGNGLLSSATIGRLCAALRPKVRVLAGDVSGRRAGLSHFRGADLLCPSESEIREASRNFSDSIPAVASALMDQTATAALMVTMGADGLIAFDRRADVQADNPFASRLRGEHIPALAGHALDPLGCGDALLSTATLTLAAGGDLVQAAFLGSIAAAWEVQRLGNLPISSAELRHGVVRAHTARLAFNPSDAVVTPRQSVAI